MGAAVSVPEELSQEQCRQLAGEAYGPLLSRSPAAALLLKAKGRIRKKDALRAASSRALLARE